MDNQLVIGVMGGGFGISDLGLMKGMLPILFLDYQLSLNVP